MLDEVVDQFVSKIKMAADLLEILGIKFSSHIFGITFSCVNSVIFKKNIFDDIYIAARAQLLLSI